MNKTLDNYLCESYPRIFVEREKSPRESCMGRGFECGSGWFPLINSLCYNIQTHIDWNNRYCFENDTNKLGLKPKKVKSKKNKRKLIPQFVALQVKEKFGGLRIYHQGGDDYCQGLVDMAASISYSICELCGNGGPSMVGHTGGWIRSICRDCSKRNKLKIVFGTEIKPMLEKAVKEDRKKHE